MNSFNYVPSKCPYCKSDLEWEGTDLYCKNNKCSKRMYDDLFRWIQVIGNTGSINGAGYSLIDSMIKMFNWNSPVDIYDENNSNCIDDSILCSTEGIGPSKYNLIKVILRNLLSPIRFLDFLVGLNIKGLSYKIADKITSNSNLEKALINNYSIESLEFESSISRNVVKYIRDNYDYVKSLYGIIKHKDDEDVSKSNTKNKLKVCITGRLLNYKSRKKFYSTYSDFISESSIADCDYLICNDEDSDTSKMNYALEHDINVITENEFYKLSGIVK